MRIAVIGTGYVGLVTATCFAESGNDVIGMDANRQKIEVLEAGRLPIYEPGLQELVQRNRREGRLNFTSDLNSAVARAQIIFVAVGTPQAAGGGADLSNLWALAESLAEHSQSDGGDSLSIRHRSGSRLRSHASRRYRRVDDHFHLRR